MKNDLKLTLLFPLLFAVLLASAALPPGARAQDATPPPSGVTPTTTPTATLEALATEPGTAVAASTPAADLAEPLADPGEPTIILVDSTGEERPVARAVAAEILAAGDPIWCPDGVAPVAGVAGCTLSYPDLAALVAALSGAQPSQNGTIWILGGTDSSAAAITLNGALLTTWRDYAIKFQGGWDNSSAGTIVGQTAFSVPLQVQSWENDITLNDLVFDTTGADGVFVTTSGNIELKNVESGGHSNRGAYLDNSAGGNAAHVTVSESSFHDNLTGLDIYTYGDITLAYVDASYNTAAGTVIENAKAVSIGTSEFNRNDLYGLVVTASDDVSLSDVEARHNDAVGALIFSDKDISVQGANFDQNGQFGMYALTNGVNSQISLKGVDARGNGASGLLIDSGRDATLTEVNASENGDSGAQVWAVWNILVEYSTFDENGQDGANMASANGDITVGCSDFRNNGGYGVDADLGTTLFLGESTFDGNGLGAYHVTGGGTADGIPYPGCEPDVEKTPVPTATPDPRRIMNVVDVEDGQVVTLNCIAYRGTVLVLSNGDQISLPCPISGQATLAHVDSDKLPAELATKFAYVSAMEAHVLPSLDGIMSVDFVIPAGKTPGDLSILRWDDTRWANLHGAQTVDGFFEAVSSLDGVFVLISE
jgi:hypothetical protein